MTTTVQPSASSAEGAIGQSGQRARSTSARSELPLYKPIVCRIVVPRLLSLHDLAHETGYKKQQGHCNRNCAPGHERLREVAKADGVMPGRDVDREKGVICAPEGDAPAVEVRAPPRPCGLADHHPAGGAHRRLEAEAGAVADG